MNDRKNNQLRRDMAIVVLLTLVELLILAVFFFPQGVEAIVGEDNVTIVSQLEVGNSFPIIVNITVNNGNSIDLTPNATTQVNVVAVVRDYNSENDINSALAEFFDTGVSSYGAGDDNNTHYTNNSCFIDTTYGNSQEANVTCTFNLYYYANNATWNFSLYVNDSYDTSDFDSALTTVNELLALGVQSPLNFGIVNASFMSLERQINVSNFGNTQFNLSLSGYARTVGDGYAMNCSLGSTNISVEHLKYNVSAPHSGQINLTDTVANYTNLSSSVVTRLFDLNYKQTEDNVVPFNSTYWRIYVPVGVAGNCSGNVVFGALRDTGI